jgi:hypothetical protein
VVSAAEATGSTGSQFYAVTALAANNVYAVGQQSGAGFPSSALIEHWNGSVWSVVSSPSDPFASALPLGVTAAGSTLTVVGQQETDTAPYTNYVATGTPSKLSIASTPDSGNGENDLFGVAVGADGTIWAAGWDINTTTGNHDPLVLQGANGSWSLAFTPGLAGDSGFAAITAIPGGGLWAVGVTSSAKGNYSTLIEWHP